MYIRCVSKFNTRKEINNTADTTKILIFLRSYMFRPCTFIISIMLGYLKRQWILQVLGNRSHFYNLLTCSLHETEPFLKSWYLFSQSRNSPHFMEPEFLLPQSPVPATCPYPEPAWSSPHTHILLSKHPFYHYIPIYACVSQVVSLHQVFPPKNLYASPLPHTCYMPRLSNFSRFYHLNNIGWAVQINKLLIM